MNKFHTPKQIAKMLQINYHRVLDMIHLGKLDAYKIGNNYRISDGQFNKFLMENRYKPFSKVNI